MDLASDSWQGRFDQRPKITGFVLDMNKKKNSILIFSNFEYSLMSCKITKAHI